ncbi:MAG: hypothetical protein GY906_25480 [bacterium]|nr:hypothetical protein [bacterium]
MPLETTSERDLLSPNAVLCERVASYFGRIAKIGYFLVAVAVSFWLVLGENREILPPGFWPMLGWTSLALCFPLSLYLWLRPSRGLREQFDSMTIKRSDLRALGRVNQALVQENSRLNQELSLLRARSDDPAVGDEILRHCFRIQNAKLEAEDTHQLYIPVREEFRVDNSLDSNYISGVCFQDFIQVLPSQRQWCQEKGFNLGRYLKRYPPAEAIDQLRFDILESHWSETSFSHDEKIYRVNDFWETPIYFRYI